MKDWNRLLSRGKRQLARHNPQEALRLFHLALDICPVENRSGLTRILFYTGITLHKLGYSGCAVKSWKAAAKIKKSGVCRRMAERLTNSYGMVTEGNGENEDLRAFSAIQQARYLVSRRLGKYGSDAERDMVSDIIRVSWENLQRKHDLSRLSTEEKIRLFHEELIIFPYLECPDEWENSTIVYDFRKNEKISRNSLCNCGSGMTYGECCGRIVSEDELEFGLF